MNLFPKKMKKSLLGGGLLSLWYSNNMKVLVIILFVLGVVYVGSAIILRMSYSKLL